MNRWSHQSQPESRTTAYTLLELMLALALLGALMTVAWSLMGTFRDAEQRGWKLSHRVQTIRSARQWLQHDMLHVIRKDATPTVASKSRLNGNSLGFTASVSPSIDPLPFLENLMSDPLEVIRESEDRQPEVSLYSDSDAVVEQARQSLWPAETMEIEYKLTPTEDAGTTAESLLQPSDLSDVQFSLTRRELLDANSLPNQGNSSLSGPQSNNLADRVLTAQDLYRQTDETVESTGVSVRETTLSGLTNANFQYFDGKGWKREWNSDQSGSLPAAIALCFDFPARADIKPPEPKSIPASGEDGLSDATDLLGSNPRDAGLSFADSALAAQPTAESSSTSESSLMQAATHEVQIVVYVGGRDLTGAGIPSLRAQPRASARGGSNGR